MDDVGSLFLLEGLMLWSTEKSKECVLHSSIEQKTQGMRVERRNDRASKRGRTVRWKKRGKEAGEKRGRRGQSICIRIGAGGMYVCMDGWMYGVYGIIWYGVNRRRDPPHQQY